MTHADAEVVLQSTLFWMQGDESDNRPESRCCGYTVLQSRETTSRFRLIRLPLRQSRGQALVENKNKDTAQRMLECVSVCVCM